jgi:hypothetical protein
MRDLCQPCARPPLGNIQETMPLQPIAMRDPVATMQWSAWYQYRHQRDGERDQTGSEPNPGGKSYGSRTHPQFQTLS